VTDSRESRAGRPARATATGKVRKLKACGQLRSHEQSHGDDNANLRWMREPFNGLVKEGLLATRAGRSRAPRRITAYVESQYSEDASA
jgi:hypothetical protein